MNLIGKKMILKSPTRFQRFQEEILKTNKTSKQKSELSLSNILAKHDEQDKDKINLENMDYIEKKIFNKKYLLEPNNTFISSKHNISNKKIHYPLIINKDNLFRNKLIRNFNKIKDIHISIFDQEISMKNLLKTTKKNNLMENKYQVIQDDRNNTINNKNKILNIIRTQTKSNFNNKYKLMFKSANKKKRNVIQNYFSLIKRDVKNDNEPINSTDRKIYVFRNNNFPELSFRTNHKKKIKKDTLNNINNSQITDKKRKLIFIPILHPNIKGKEHSKENK
jgi:hypothetical protein